ncbi:MAG: Trehalose utilization [Verrucomicrobiales bacterium]|nr:Trehalose utilization [Verrucomicrobiales bacterium]
MNTFYRSAIAVVAFAWVGSPCMAQDAKDKTTPFLSDADLMKQVTIPPGFEATIFGKPPEVNYPVFVSAAVDGTLYISSDRNGSLDRSLHRGRIIRARDTDGDGKADEFKLFVPDVDSPRGLVWDHDRLYLMHPPHISVYVDKDGDGVVDEEKILVKNIAFGFKDRPADHTSNGLELGIDGWIYCAIGDFGFMEAEGTDGRKLQLRGGGVVRVRPDGSGLELYSRGTRNILEAAVSPNLDIFARDNTNDGDGWDIRFHHFVGLSEHGYPSLFKHFSGEYIERIADYGNGSGCGALFLSEPGFPNGYNDAIYTADWGRDWIYRHNPTPRGATFAIDQTQFIHSARTTDLDVDGMSRLYISSWRGATFNYTGENVGYVLQVKPKGYKPEPLPNFAKASPPELLEMLKTPSHRRRLEAQRELVRRGLDGKSISGLVALANDEAQAMPVRVAAIFALKQGLHAQAAPILQKLLATASVREYAVRALTDRLEELEGVQSSDIVKALSDSNPRVRREAAFAVARLGKPENAVALEPVLGDPDPIVAHTAVQAVKVLNTSAVAFHVIDSNNSSSEQRLHAFHVLQSLHNAEVVTGLIDRLGKNKDPELKHGLITALSRLYYKDGEWKGNSWGTRPDTSGPYYQPEEWAETPRIKAVLKAELLKSSPQDAGIVMEEMARHKIQADDATDTIIGLALANPSLAAPAIAQLSRADSVPVKALPILIKASHDSASSPETLSMAVVSMTKVNDPQIVEPILSALVQLKATASGDKEFRAARDAFFKSSRLDQNLESLKTIAASQGPLSSWADAILMEISERKQSSPEARTEAKAALEAAWQIPVRRVQIIEAVALGEKRSWQEKVMSSVNDPDPGVVKAVNKTVATMRWDRARAAANTASPKIEKLKVEQVMVAVQTKHGTVKAGEELFTRLGCVNCHTTTADQALKGPFLGTIASIYKRPELAEAILLPNKTIAQGFATHHFELKDGTEVDGFVTQEAADKVTIRNVAAQEMEIKLSNIAKRAKLETSIMPEGLVANLTVEEFASLLDYLESLNARK